MHTPAAMHSNATYNHNTSTHDAQQAGLQQQIADLSRVVQGMHALLTTQNVGAGLGGGYNNNSAPHATQQHFAAMNTQQQQSAGYGSGGGGRIPGRPSPCNLCGRLHHPQATCYGPRYANRPVVQPGPLALLTAPPMSTNVSERSESAFASNANIQWPSINNMIGIVGDSCMSAAAPVPFMQGKRADMQESSASTNAPVPPTLPPAQPEHATLQTPPSKQQALREIPSTTSTGLQKKTQKNKHKPIIVPIQQTWPILLPQSSGIYQTTVTPLKHICIFSINWKMTKLKRTTMRTTRPSSRTALPMEPLAMLT